jgi:hypothetical protein
VDHPALRPAIIRPPLIWSTVARAFASWMGTWSGATSTDVPRRTFSVTAAAAVSTAKGSAACRRLSGHATSGGAYGSAGAFREEQPLVRPQAGVAGRLVQVVLEVNEELATNLAHEVDQMNARIDTLTRNRDAVLRFLLGATNDITERPVPPQSGVRPTD